MIEGDRSGAFAVSDGCSSGHLSVPTFLQTVRAVGGFLDRAATHCAETGADPEDFVNARLLCALRRIGLKHTQFAKATCGTIRLELLKIGALVTRSVRRVKVAMASGYARREAFELARRALTVGAF